MTSRLAHRQSNESTFPQKVGNAGYVLSMIVLRLPVLADMDQVLMWRNSPEVAPYMYRDDPIPAHEHAKWFPTTTTDSPTARYRVAELNGTSVGWTSLTRIDLRNRSCEWGGYLAPSAPRSSGIGRLVLEGSLRMAFAEMNMNRIVVEVLVGNDRALHLYESLGFKREGVLRERAWHSSGPRDAIALSMLATEWTPESI